MISNTIPAVLTFDPPQASISTERALKNAIMVLKNALVAGESMEDSHNTAIDDLELMLKAIR